MKTGHGSYIIYGKKYHFYRKMYLFDRELVADLVRRGKMRQTAFGSIVLLFNRRTYEYIAHRHRIEPGVDM